MVITIPWRIHERGEDALGSLVYTPEQGCGVGVTRRVVLNGFKLFQLCGKYLVVLGGKGAGASSCWEGLTISVHFCKL